MRHTLNNSDDLIDSRDVIARIASLEDDAEAGTLDDGEADELAALKALAEEAEGCAEDWLHGVTLIRDTYFEDYARELAEEIGALKDDAAWPCTCIDWERAAHELQMDYTAVEFDGVTYWVR